MMNEDPLLNDGPVHGRRMYWYEKIYVILFITFIMTSVVWLFYQASFWLNQKKGLLVDTDDAKIVGLTYTFLMLGLMYLMKKLIVSLVLRW